MRLVVRAVALALLSFALAVPASAHQLILYRGTTSAPSHNRVRIFVSKDPVTGARKVVDLRVAGILTCEDATTYPFILHVGHSRPVDENGDFEFEALGLSFFFHLDGTVRWAKASGTFEYSYATVTADGQASQLCTTGDLTWRASRIIVGGAAQHAATPATVNELRLRVDGAVEMVELG